MQEKYVKLVTRSCSGLMACCFGFTFITQFINRGWEGQFRSVDWMHFAVFAALPVAAAASVVFGVRVYKFKKKTEADKSMLLMSTMAAFVALACMGPMNAAFYGALFKGQQRIVYGDGLVRITGAIADNLALQLEAHSDPALHLVRVELEGPGGDPAGALAGGRWLRAHGVDRVVVTGDCASACAMMALLFAHRDIAPAARLGFHAIISPSGDNIRANGVQGEIKSAIAENGIAPDLVATLFKSRDVAWFTRDELVSAKLATGCWDITNRQEVECQK